MLVVGAAGRPSREKNLPVRNHRRRTWAGGHAAHNPLWLSGLEVVADHPSMAGRHDLFALGGVPDDGRAVGVYGLPSLLPHESPIGQAQSHDARPLGLVSYEYDQAVG